MQSSNKKNAKKVLRYIAAGVLSFGLVHATDVAKAQGPPPPPPPPDKVIKKVGNDLKKINTFKKVKRPPAPGNRPAGAPKLPPPPPKPPKPPGL
jgi:hypothetical protein